MRSNPTGTTTLDPAEIAKFERMAAEWWDAGGKFRPLHRFNPVRLGYIRDVVVAHSGRDPKAARPFAGLRLLDIGCGGGILCEPLARLGAETIGIDPSAVNVGIASLHAEHAGLSIDYRTTTAEALAGTEERFDIVLAMEVVEHVANVPAFIAAASALVRPGGLLFVATINRTAKAFALAIVGAEYLLRWLPRGTHEYEKLVRPAELEGAFRAAGLVMRDETGVRYNPVTDCWSRSADMDVNYMVVAEKPREPAA